MDAAAVVRQAFDMVNTRRFERAAEIIAGGFVRHDLADVFGETRGPAGVQDLLAMLVAAMPDLELRIEQILTAGDHVTVRFHGTGTHSGEHLLGVPATGSHIEWNGINIYRVDADRIAESWQLSDGLALYRALGILPSTG